MGNKYIYPTEKFNVKLDLEIEVKFIGVWSGLGLRLWLGRRVIMI